MVANVFNTGDQKKNVLFVGTRNAKYHPMDGIDLRLSELLPEMNLIAAEETGALDPIQLKSCSVCILYLEFDLPVLSDCETAALITYVAEGGSLFVIHNGISVQGRSELSQLIGAKFTGHPPYIELPLISYHVEKPDHDIFKGVTDFAMKDEAYQFEMDPFADMEFLLSYDFEEKRVPAGWQRRYGKGRMVYFCCGHNKEGFYNKQFSNILSNTVHWLSESEEGKND
jgi:type 1 glutamine amidotransferase